MKDGGHIESVYRSTYSKQERNWIPLLLASCLLILLSVCMMEQGRQLEREQREVYTNEYQ